MAYRRFRNTEEILGRLITKLILKLVVFYNMKDKLYNCYNPNKADNRLCLFKAKHREYYATCKVECKFSKKIYIGNA